MPSNTESSGSASADVSHDVLPPSGIGPGSVVDARYRLEALVGRGGTATVYRGTDELLGRPVAVKMFNPHLTDPVMLARQHQEMRVVAGFQHPNLVAVYDARMTDTNGVAADIGTGYLVLEFVDGPSLAERLNQDAMNSAEVAGIGAAIASALQVVHDGGLVHRDIKPGNILLTSAGQPKLSDFGIARALHAERVTNSADVLGTAPYLSPEQARGGEVGPATDVYALGLVLLECLTGHREYPGPAVEAAVARLLRDPVIPNTLPPPWPELLQSMTSSDPKARPTAADVTATLGGDRDRAATLPLGHGPTPQGHTGAATLATIVDANTRTPATFAEPVRQPRRPFKALVLAGAAGVLAVVATLAILTNTGDQTTPTSPTPDTGGTPISTPAPVPPSTFAVGQPAVVVVTATPESTVPQPAPATSQPDDQTPDTTPVITSAESVTGEDGVNGNGNEGNGNGNNGNVNNENGNNGNGNENNGNGNNGNGNNGNGNNGNGNGG